MTNPVRLRSNRCVDGSLLPLLDPEGRAMLEDDWGTFAAAIDWYEGILGKRIADADRTHGRRFAVRLVERFVARGVITRRLTQWPRDRLTARAYHDVEEYELAARYLRASLLEHHCTSGSCRVGPSALAYLYLLAGRGFEAVMASMPYGSAPGLLHDRVNELIDERRMARLVHELIAERRRAAGGGRFDPGDRELLVDPALERAAKRFWTPARLSA